MTTCTTQRKAVEKSGYSRKWIAEDIYREREPDMCGSSKRKPLEAKVLNPALRSDKSERYLVPHCVEQGLSPALC